MTIAHMLMMCCCKYIRRFYRFLSSKLKLIVLVCITSYFYVAMLDFNRSGNWEATRQIGLMQDMYCRDPFALQYGVQNFMYDNLHGVPICFQNDKQNFRANLSSAIVDNLCMSTNIEQSCIRAFQLSELTQLNSDHLKENFRVPVRVYIYNATMIIILGTVSSILTFFFEDKRMFRLVAMGEFATQHDRSMMIRFNALCVTFIIIFVFMAISSYILIKQEDCTSIYVTNNKSDEFCAILNGCGGVLGSVISPQGWPCENFRMISLSLCCLLIVSVLLQCTNARGDHNASAAAILYQRARAHNRVFDIAMIEANHHDLMDYDPYRPNLFRVGFVYDGVDDGRPAAAGQADRDMDRDRDDMFRQLMVTRADRQSIINNWHIVTGASQLSDHSECSICLLDLFAAPGPAPVMRDECEGDTATATPDQINNMPPTTAATGAAVSTINTPRNAWQMWPDTTEAAGDRERHRRGRGRGALQDDHTVVVQTQCGHCFHKSCILMWCFSQHETKSSCPVCRRSMT